MKILAFADLHIDLFRIKNNDLISFKQKQKIREIICLHKPDFITISGDVFERYVEFHKKNEVSKLNLYKTLNNIVLIQDDLEEKVCSIPVIFCLGNHEFAYNSIEECKKAFEYAENENGNRYNIHCLDIVGNVEFDSTNFVGNVLWYDGSCSKREDRINHIKNIYDGWLDSTIKDFDAIKENKKCIEQIKNGIVEHKTNVLITHMVPTYNLNVHNKYDPTSIFNVYSGHGNLFKDYDINVDVAISGHTHLPAFEHYYEVGYSTRCFNIGNDYYFKTENITYNIIEV